ncbi:uncharacterized protein LOC135469045 [Liolophura sinensis]|uniref:uncharacterized protein LOC135469045 n=1 Tax=Liolophura sinensis TaxID=3198878 RepID=UPI0031594E49
MVYMLKGNMERILHLAYTVVIISVLVTLSSSKTVDIKIPDIYGANVKDVETVVKEEEQRLRDLHENPEFEELQIIDDPLEIPKILAKPRNANGDVIEEFKPIPLPTDFDSYDVDPKDGRIHLSELITVTGAVENVEAAFNASDTDKDGVISLQEFMHAPWNLSGADEMDYVDIADADMTSGDAEEEYLHLIHR